MALRDVKEAELAELERAISVVETEIASLKALANDARYQAAAVAEFSRHSASEFAALRDIAEKLERLLGRR